MKFNEHNKLNKNNLHNNHNNNSKIHFLLGKSQIINTIK